MVLLQHVGRLLLQVPDTEVLSDGGAVSCQERQWGQWTSARSCWRVACQGRDPPAARPLVPRVCPRLGRVVRVLRFRP